jgi:preprotein translocase subunit SecG
LRYVKPQRLNEIDTQQFGASVETLIWVVHVLTAVVLIGLVLVQHGKGADMGAAFGSGSAGSLFGSSGSANFLSRSTAVAATVFFITSMTLTYLYGHAPQGTSVMDRAGALKTLQPAAAEPQQTPVAPGGAAPASKAGEIPK